MIINLDGFTFERELRGTLQGHERAAYVTLYDVQFYDRCTCLAVVRSGRIRALGAITREGELISLMRTAWGKGDDVAGLVSAALDTGNVRYLECYDGRLPTLYADYGFSVAERFPFDENAAAPTWNYARDGRPDYLRMTYNGRKVA